MSGREFIIVVRDLPGGSFKYHLYVVPAGGDRQNLDREFITSADTLWGARRAIRKERKRRAKGVQVVHREAL